MATICVCIYTNMYVYVYLYMSLYYHMYIFPSSLITHHTSLFTICPHRDTSHISILPSHLILTHHICPFYHLISSWHITYVHFTISSWHITCVHFTISSWHITCVHFTISSWHITCVHFTICPHLDTSRMYILLPPIIWTNHTKMPILPSLIILTHHICLFYHLMSAWNITYVHLMTSSFILTNHINAACGTI